LPLVHPHVKIAFEAKGETAGGFVELVATDTKVGEDTIHGGDFMQPKESFQVAKVVGQELDAVVIGEVDSGVLILVEGEKPACRTQSFQDTPGMTTAAKGAVNIATSRSDPEVVKSFLQQDGEVISTLLVM
jgi:hypothetical protein